MQRDPNAPQYTQAQLRLLRSHRLHRRAESLHGPNLGPHSCLHIRRSMLRTRTQVRRGNGCVHGLAVHQRRLRGHQLCASCAACLLAAGHFCPQWSPTGASSFRPSEAGSSQEVLQRATNAAGPQTSRFEVGLWPLCVDWHGGRSCSGKAACVCGPAYLGPAVDCAFCT